jgi:hypothetical protein
MSNRHQRRANVADFKRAVHRRHLVTHLVDAAEPLDGHAVLKDALSFWQKNRVKRRPCCIGCRADLSDPDVEAGAYLFATSPGSPGVASVSALCCACWHDLPLDQIEHHALRVLRRLLPGGHFEPRTSP